MKSKRLAVQDHMTTAPDPKERRRTVRKRVLWGAVLESSGSRAECVVVNLSLGGARIHLTAPVELGRNVTLELGRFGALAAVVVWQRERSCGLQFSASEASVAAQIGVSLPLTAGPSVIAS